MAKQDERDPYAVKAGERLATLRRALDYKSTRALARAFDIPEDRVGTWTRGVALVPPAFLDDLAAEHRLPALQNYVYAGDASGLPHWLALRVQPRRA